MPYSMVDLLGMGIRPRPEQVHMHDELTGGHGMVVYAVQDPVHAADCTESCNYPVELENGQPLMVPMPVTFGDAIDDRGLAGEFDADTYEEHFDEVYGKQWRDYPSIPVTIDGPVWGPYGRHPYFVWDVWPLDDQAYEDLKNQLWEFFEDFGLHNYELYAAIEYGEVSAYDEVYSRLDHEFIQELHDADEDDLVWEYIDEEATKYRDNLEMEVYESRQHWNDLGVQHHLGLERMGLDQAWRGLRASSLRNWEALRRSFKPSERNVQMHRFKELNPWP